MKTVDQTGARRCRLYAGAIVRNSDRFEGEQDQASRGVRVCYPVLLKRICIFRRPLFVSVFFVS